MPLINVVKSELNNWELVTKCYPDNLRIGTQLVVYPGQVAFFVKGGKLYDCFEAGTYTIETSNIPLLDKVINLPFGESPFKAEVWYVNVLNILDSKWGTSNPILLEDPKYNIIVPVRAHGQYGLKISDPKMFIESLVGNMSSFTVDRVDSYFKGKIMSLMTNLISDKITKDKISLLNINSYVSELSEYLTPLLRMELNKYGINIVNFYIISITVPTNDPSVIKLKEAKDLAARLKITGRDLYQMDRSFDVLDKVASNEGAGGSMVSMGAGIGAGVGIGGALGNLYMQNMNTGVGVPPQLPNETKYFVFLNGKQVGNLTAQQIVDMFSSGQISMDTLIWRYGLSQWVKLKELSELLEIINSQTPPPINI